MISIQLSAGTLDTFIDTEIDLSWIGFRFQSELRDSYTNDITIPKTKNNIAVLGAVGLLDSGTQMFGNNTTDAVLYCNSMIIKAKVQVVAVREMEIDICVYEDTFPEEIRDKQLYEIFEDDSTSIYRWNPASYANYPSVFPRYNYGMTFNPEKAQRHPIRSVNNILSDIGNEIGVNMVTVDNHLSIMATKKTVCPQNPTQVIEFDNDDLSANNVFKLHGGLHITNDLAMENIDKITYNRNTHASFTIWLVWGHFSSQGSANSSFGTIQLKKNGVLVQNITFPTGGAYNGSYSTNFGIQINKDDELEFICVDTFSFISVIARANYANYSIVDDDYGIDLEYVSRYPELYVLDGGGTKHYLPFDGDYHSWNGLGLNTTMLSFAYYGYYCNLADVTLGEFLHSLQWIVGQKLFLDETGLNWRSPDESIVLDGVITEIRPSSDKFGQKNYIKYANEDKNTDPICTIDNKWLEDEKILHQSVFYNGVNAVDPTGMLKVDQYTLEEDGDVSFDEVDGMVICYFDTTILTLYPLTINNFKLYQIDQTMEVDIETDTIDVKDKDIIYLDGREFFVIEGSTDLTNGHSNITGILINNSKLK